MMNFNIFLTTLFLIRTVRTQIIEIESNENYFYHRACTASCRSNTCFFKSNNLMCLPHCPKSCPTRRSPVCGSDGETYLNRCLLKMRNCHVKKEAITMVSRGECPFVTPNRSPDCNINCSLFETRPVCATDGRTYDNYCQVTKAACLAGQNIEFRHYGSCQETACSFVRCPLGQICKITVHGNPSCNCDSDCPLRPEPICGNDGKTYYNQCHLDAENCLTGSAARRVSTGICNTYDERKRRIHRASVAFGPE